MIMVGVVLYVWVVVDLCVFCVDCVHLWLYNSSMYLYA